MLVRNCAAVLSSRRRGGGRIESGRLCVAANVVVVVAVVGADRPRESECRSGRTTGRSGTNIGSGARRIGGRRCDVRAVSRGGIHEGLVLELANTVADNFA